MENFEWVLYPWYWHCIKKFPFILDRNLAKANCTENHVCTSCDTVVLLVKSVFVRRATNMNLHSSRSHAIFILTVESSELGVDGVQHIKAGKLNLVDLAGSERQAKTGSSVSASSQSFSLKNIKYLLFVIKIFALKNFKINIHQHVSRAFNILHYNNLFHAPQNNFLWKNNCPTDASKLIWKRLLVKFILNGSKWH